MDILVYAGIYVCFILIALGTVAVLGFGVRGLREGKVSLLTAAAIGSPIVLAILLGLIFGDWVKGAIIACMVMFACALVAVLANGVRGLITA